MHKWIGKLLLIGLILRLVVVVLSANIKNYDLQSYLFVGGLTRNGQNIYPQVALLHHPYFPLILYLEALAIFFGQNQTIFLKIVFSLFDTAIIYLVYRLSKNEKPAFLYAVNPVSILITSFHGQFDAIPLFFLLLAIMTIQFKPRWLNSMFFLSIAITVKTWPVLFVLPFLKRMKNWRQILTSLIILSIVPVLSITGYIFIFKADPLSIVTTIKSYRPVFGVFGLGLIVKNLFHRQDINFVNDLTHYFLLIFLIYQLLIKRRNVGEEILSLLLIFFILTPVFGIQWLIWLVSFILIFQPRGTLLFFLFATSYILANYFYWLGIRFSEWSFLSGLALWLSLIFIFWQRNFIQFFDIKRSIWIKNHLKNRKTRSQPF